MTIETRTREEAAIKYVREHYHLWSEPVSPSREAVEILLNEAGLMQVVRQVTAGEIVLDEDDDNE